MVLGVAATPARSVRATYGGGTGLGRRIPSLVIGSRISSSRATSRTLRSAPVEVLRLSQRFVCSPGLGVLFSHSAAAGHSSSSTRHRVTSCSATRAARASLVAWTSAAPFGSRRCPHRTETVAACLCHLAVGDSGLFVGHALLTHVRRRGQTIILPPQRAQPPGGRAEARGG